MAGVLLISQEFRPIGGREPLLLRPMLYGPCIVAVEVRFAPVYGHAQLGAALLLSAKSRLSNLVTDVRFGHV